MSKINHSALHTLQGQSGRDKCLCINLKEPTPPDRDSP